MKILYFLSNNSIMALSDNEAVTYPGGCGSVGRVCRPITGRLVV